MIIKQKAGLGYMLDGTVVGKFDYIGLSTDVKPTAGVNTNDLFFELDTKKLKYFDGTAWTQVGV